MDIPTVYWIFYEFFFKSCIGDAKWKLMCTEYNQESDRLGTFHEEAFAMLVLKNNYFAWLWEAKRELITLVTDYDTRKDLLKGKKNVNEEYLKWELNLEGGDQNVLESSSEEEESDSDEEGDAESGSQVHKNQQRQQECQPTEKNEKRIIVNPSKTDELYKKLKQASDRATVMAREKAKRSENYKSMMHDIHADVGNVTTLEGRRKKRKIMSQFREYTTKKGNECKFKGWSNRAPEEMAEMVKELEKEKEKNEVFNVAYRRLHKRSVKKTSKEEIKEKVPDSIKKACWDISAEEYALLEQVEV